MAGGSVYGSVCHYPLRKLIRLNSRPSGRCEIALPINGEMTAVMEYGAEHSKDLRRMCRLSYRTPVAALLNNKKR